MKKVVLAVVFAFVAITTLSAQEKDAFTTDTENLVSITSMSAFKGGIDQMSAMVTEDKKTDFKIDAEKTLTGLVSKIAKVYMDEFTHEEVKDMLIFYKSPTGKKMADKTMTLMQKSMMVGQSWSMEMQQIVAKYAK
jgi:uncharacterized protein